MQITYRLIDCGVVINTQVKDFDGVEEINATRIASDLFDGTDPLKAAQRGERATWVEAYCVE